MKADPLEFRVPRRWPKALIYHRAHRGTEHTESNEEILIHIKKEKDVCSSDQLSPSASLCLCVLCAGLCAAPPNHHA
jgi:hypothetical protein